MQLNNDPNYSFKRKAAFVESGNNNLAKNPKSTAVGRYQFLEGTWNDYIKRFNLPYTLEDRKDPKKAEVVMNLYTEESRKVLRNVLGSEPRDTDLYLAHFLGQNGAKRFFQTYNQDRNLPISSVMSQKEIDANRNVAYNKDGSLKTLEQFYGWADSKMSGKMPTIPKAPLTFNAQEETVLPTLPTEMHVSPLVNQANVQTDLDRKVEEVMQKQTQENNFLNEIQNLIASTQLEYVEPEQYLFQGGGEMIKRKDGSYSRRGLWDNIRANRGSGKEPTKEMLEQERKIRKEQDGGEIEYDYVNYGTPEYKEAYEQGRFAHRANELEAVEVSPRQQKYPFYHTLSENEKKYFDDDSPIGRQIRTKALDGEGFNAEKAKGFTKGMLMDIPLSGLQAPQSAMVEGIEAIRGNEFNMLNALEPGKQRVPSETLGFDTTNNSWYHPKSVSNFAMDAVADPSILTGVGAARKPIQKGLQQTGEYLTTQTPLKDAWKLNPWAFKPNPEMGYRMLGKEGFEDALNTGVLRAKPAPIPKEGELVEIAGSKFNLAKNKNRNPNTGRPQPALDRPYFADGFIDERYAADYMAAVNKVDNNLIQIPTHKGIAPSQAGSIPLENATLYKKDWLKGYKQIDVPKQQFKSEIDWAKWNKEIPENTQLMKEYNAIEQQTKANGTWMKYSDGSEFKGTPEQFIQMKHPNTQNYAGGADAAEQMYKNPLYRGAHKHIVDFKNRDRNDWATFLTNSEKNAESYAGSDGTVKKFFHPDIDKEIEVYGKFYPLTKDGKYQLTFPQNLSTVTGNAEGRSWQLLNYDENIAKNVGGYKKHDGTIINYADDHNTYLKNIHETKNNLESYGIAEYNPSKKYLSTDNYAAYVKNTNNSEGIAKIDNVVDTMGEVYTKPTTVYAIDAERVPIKSLMYNNGMFDITNPNIYKSVLPLAGAAAATQLGNEEELPQMRKGGVIKDNMGYWNPDNWGKVVEINSPNITMEGVSQPLLGISKETGEQKIMLPNQEYYFDNTQNVIEIPLNEQEFLKELFQK